MSDSAIVPPLVDAGVTRDDLFYALCIAVAVSLILACIQIQTKSRTSLQSCFVIQSVFYWFVLSFGNVVTTLLVSTSISKLPTSLSPYYYLFCVFFGVFGFEAILKNTNITMFDRGVLTIQNWTETALNSAAAVAIEKQERIKQRFSRLLSAKLMTLDEEEINTHILHKCGAVVAQLEADARSSSANAKHYKILFLISKLTPSEASAFMRTL